jgi:uncharacterized membrane protein YcaP (DUF421 family)
MKKEDIHVGDWQRMFLGEVPGGFYLEVVFRIAVIYLILMVSMRLMGKRMASQLSRNEMIALVSLAAAIGVPLQAPDRGVLAAVVIAMVVILVQQAIAKLSSKNQKLESITQGDLTILVSDGHLNLKNMKQTGITRERAFSQLRNNSIKQLGEVKRLYFEAAGTFTLIRNPDAAPGLGVLPLCDEEFARRVYQVSDNLICQKCGYPYSKDENDPDCSNCGSNEWTNAVS